MSLIAVFMVMLFDDTDVLVEAEDGTGEEERLGDVVEQTASHVVDVDHLVGHERDAAHDEQHRTGILRDFEARVFHGIFLKTRIARITLIVFPNTDYSCD